jgi:hypothetical protein
MWIIIPTILVFAFSAWVFYAMLEDVSERSFYGEDIMSSCTEGCQRPPIGTIQP